MDDSERKIVTERHFTKMRALGETVRTSGEETEVHRDSANEMRFRYARETSHIPSSLEKKAKNEKNTQDHDPEPSLDFHVR